MNPGDAITYTTDVVVTYFNDNEEKQRTETTSVDGTFVRYAGEAEFMCVISVTIDGAAVEKTVPVSKVALAA